MFNVSIVEVDAISNCYTKNNSKEKNPPSSK